MDRPNIDTVRALQREHSNWHRWGDHDERGTLNHATPERIERAARLVRDGRVLSLALPFDGSLPQSGLLGRFNPIHVMRLDGADALAGTAVRDFGGGEDRHLRAADDMIVMPLQCGTQWDALSHIFFEGRMYNGYSAGEVTSAGARRCDVRVASAGCVGRGVLLDLPRHLARPWLEPGHAIGAGELEECARAQGVELGPGDFLLVRTGQLAQCRAEGSWGTYAGGPAPGLGLSSIGFIAERELAGVATDTWGMEVIPYETEDVAAPLHLVLIVHVGLWVGEMFDLEALAVDCQEDGRYAFLLSAAPLPFTGAVGSPINPVAIK